MMQGLGLLLLSAVGGYWVLVQGSARKGELQRVGRLLGSIVIIVSLIGVGYVVVSVMNGVAGCSMGDCRMGKRAMMGSSCPFTSRMKSGVSSAAPTPSAPERTPKKER